MIIYQVDPSKNPATWPAPVPESDSITASASGNPQLESASASAFEQGGLSGGGGSDGGGGSGAGGAGAGGFIDIPKVDVLFININTDSDFRILHTGTNENLQHALTQVTKHVARGLYRVVSLNASEYACHVVISTGKPREELMWKNGFPWDRVGEELDPVVLK